MITDSEYSMIHTYHRLRIAYELVGSMYGYPGMTKEENDVVRETLESTITRIGKELPLLCPDLEDFTNDQLEIKLDQERNQKVREKIARKCLDELLSFIGVSRGTLSEEDRATTIIINYLEQLEIKRESF